VALPAVEALRDLLRKCGLSLTRAPGRAKVIAAIALATPARCKLPGEGLLARARCKPHGCASGGAPSKFEGLLRPNVRRRFNA
jgi:hypothetical protein